MKEAPLFLCILSLFLSSALTEDSCTVFSVKANDGTIIIRRSMEFALYMKYDIAVVLRDLDLFAPRPSCELWIGVENKIWILRRRRNFGNYVNTQISR